MAVALLISTATVFMSGTAPAGAAGVCGPPVTSVIACENLQPGDPRADWQVTGAGDAALQGFSTAMSVKPGDTVSFKVNASAAAYHVDILRFGYYQGNGARKVATLTGPFPRNTQPACTDQVNTGLIDCGNWSVSLTWAVPSNAVSGVYAAHLVRNDTGGSSMVPFVVRDEASHSDIVVQTSDTTWQAYNTYGGNSLYSCTGSCPPGSPKAYKGASKVSYNRPFHSAADDAGRSWLTYAELPMISFLEANGYDVSYLSGTDVDSSGSLLLNHKTFVSSGHDEYWSGNQRANVEYARDHGVNLAFFSGNEVFWKTRFESDNSGRSNRILVAYKDTHYDAPTDPVDWTGTWRDPRFRAGQPENALTGQYFTVNSGTTDIKVPSQYAALRLWRNTAVASLGSGQTLTLAPGTGTLGYEWDVEPDNGFRPAGLFDLSSTTSSSAQTFVDYGSVVADNQTATHHLSLYRAPSGALVFGAGTVQWSWGLDTTNPSGRPVDRNMQQATVNLLAEMGSQPATPIGGLITAAASSNRTPPTSTISNPAAGAAMADGTRVTVSGSATASGGSVVAGVEVSTDNGTTWHPATIPNAAATTAWSYSWIAHGNPSTRLRSRAVDDSGNVEAPSSGSLVNVACPCSVWGPNVTPGTVDQNDVNAVELGVKFTSDVAGSIAGIRFYKSTANTGSHIGNLWTASGTLLASATFTSETTSGWQQVTFPAPVPIAANTTYVASYFAPKGHYSADGTYLYGQPAPASGAGSITDSVPLHVTRSSPTSGDGLYRYGSSSGFPTSTFDGENYWVDVSFVPAAPPTVPTQVTGVVAVGTRRVGRSVVVGALERWESGHLLHRDAVHRRRASGRHDRHRQPSGHLDDCWRTHERHRVHLQRGRHERCRHRIGIDGIGSGHAGAGDGAGPGHKRHGSRRERVGRRVVDGAPRWRCHDHLVHGDALRGCGGPGGDLDLRDPAGHGSDDHRADQLHDLYVHCEGHERRRCRSVVGALGGDHPIGADHAGGRRSGVGQRHRHDGHDPVVQHDPGGRDAGGLRRRRRPELVGVPDGHRVRRRPHLDARRSVQHPVRHVRGVVRHCGLEADRRHRVVRRRPEPASTRCSPWSPCSPARASVPSRPPPRHRARPPSRSPPRSPARSSTGSETTGTTRSGEPWAAAR